MNAYYSFESPDADSALSSPSPTFIFFEISETLSSFFQAKPRQLSGVEDSLHVSETGGVNAV